MSTSLLVHAPATHRYLLSFPTRRSSDLGKLTGEEFETMKTHTTIGAEILSGSRSPLLVMAEQIALTHHERWDGQGYPHGLQDRKSTRLNSSHANISYAVFCLKKKSRPYM